MSDPVWPEPPPGFTLDAVGEQGVYAATSRAEAVRARGLCAWTAWERALATGASGSGRGATVVVDGGSGTRWRLKAMRRGGRLAAFWRGRYPSGRRLVATLASSVEALSRGVPTADPVALIVAADRYGFVRGAMAFQEIEGSEDLARRVGSRHATRAELVATMGAVRAMHDRGVVHPDLNLGNVLLRQRSDGSPEVFLIDFDRATFVPGPLPFGARQAALRRLERSCAKLTGATGPLGPGSEDLWYDAYAGGDVALRRRLEAGRAWGRFVLAIHRLSWKRRTS